jgi:hypothetical protein
LIKKSSLGPAKVVIGILSIVVGLFLTLFGGIAFLFRSFGGTADLSILLAGLVFMFIGIWMVFDAFFEDVEVRINNLDELAVAFGRRAGKCPKCRSLFPLGAKFCMNCGKEIRKKSEE